MYNQYLYFQREHKVLLLGPGESGKSTIFKQMRIILQQGYTKEELLEFKETVYVNVIKNMKSLVDAVKKFNYPLASEENEVWKIIFFILV